MGCNCLDFKEIVFKLEGNDIILNISLKNGDQNKVLFKNIYVKEDLETFIEIINKIYKKIDIDNNIKENINILKISIKQITSKILKEEEINRYLQSIDNVVKNKYNLEEIMEIKKLLQFIYSYKGKIDSNQRIYFIESIISLLKETKELNDEEVLICREMLKQIFLEININIINIENKDNDEKNDTNNNITNELDFISEANNNDLTKNLLCKTNNNNNPNNMEFPKKR